MGTLNGFGNKDETRAQGGIGGGDDGGDDRPTEASALHPNV
jgi:hypothetical protein